MSKMFRLTKEESKKLQELCMKINKIKINNGVVPLKDTELLHEIIKLSLPMIRLNKRHEIIIDPD